MTPSFSPRLSLIQAIRGHIQTLVPYFFRKVSLPECQALEIPTPDGDVLDADYYPGRSTRLAILTHGLEGSSQSVYIRVLARKYLEAGHSVLCWNLRGCGRRLNQKARLYHSGAAEDLLTVVQFAREAFQPERMELGGFSLGGNLTLVCLARYGAELETLGVDWAQAVSVPLNLAASSRKLLRWFAAPYHQTFFRALKSKIHRKEAQLPGTYPIARMDQARTLWAFDDAITAPLHGFVDAADYYRKCSSLYCLSDIRIPTRILIAQNDPMLARGNYPELVRLNTPFLEVCLVENGGHCGFWGFPGPEPRDSDFP